MSDVREIFVSWAAWLTCACAAALSAFPAAGAPAQPPPVQASPPQAGSVAVAGFTYVKSLAGIDEYRLDANGLTVLLVPDHSAPVVTFQVTYEVGSRNEVTGTTGATHILEHMMFKGSSKVLLDKIRGSTTKHA